MDFTSSLWPQQATERRCEVVNSVRASFLFFDTQLVRHKSLVVSNKRHAAQEIDNEHPDLTTKDQQLTTNSFAPLSPLSPIRAL